MPDKFKEARLSALLRVSKKVDLPHDKVIQVYQCLEDLGLIDYDIEKDVFLGGEDDEEK